MDIGAIHETREYNVKNCTSNRLARSAHGVDLPHGMV